jgi:acetylornithine aminotransferase
LSHTSNLYGIDTQTHLAKRLCGISAMDAVFFCNSGAEANEAAIKLARLYGHRKGIDYPTIVVMENSFHGRTLATLTATGNRRAQAGFEPLIQGFIRIPYNDLAALEAVSQTSADVVAVLLEPIQGEGGVHIPDKGYLSSVRKICDQHAWLMMLDEVQSGIARTGKWFCHQHEQAIPDVLCTAKALGNGFPIGACLARGDAAQVFSPGTHGSTFGGNPMACQAALAVITTIDKQELDRRAEQLGQYIHEALKHQLRGTEGIQEIRNRGLMIGVELDRPCRELVDKALQKRLLINVTADKVIRLLPPLIINDRQADIIIETVSELVIEFLALSSEN